MPRLAPDRFTTGLLGQAHFNCSISVWIGSLRWPQKIAAARLSYNCDTLFGMERAISIRLDDDAQHALRVLTKSGRSQSEAVREALIALARSRRRADLANEAERLNADRGDRAEKKKIAKMMESLRAAG